MLSVSWMNKVKVVGPSTGSNGSITNLYLVAQGLANASFSRKISQLRLGHEMQYFQ